MFAIGMFLAGAAGGWLVRGRFVRVEIERARAQAQAPVVDAESEATTPAPAARTHDDELREILADPQGRALAARVRNASRVGDDCEIEVDTSVGWFRAACGSGETPSVGDKFELFGKLSPTGQIDGAPPLLRPSWLEPVGTLGRLRGQ